ncbi:MAG: hypothetical protein QW728_03905 [Thermoplasmata archaeon]
MVKTLFFILISVPEKKTVLLDSNALFLPFKFKLDVKEGLLSLLGACDILVPDFILKEIQTMIKHKVEFAKAAYTYAGRFPVLDFEKLIKERDFDLSAAGGKRKRWRTDIAPQEHALDADSKLVITGVLLKAYVLTNDNKLKKRLRSAGVPVIYLRGIQTFALDGQLDIL